jgi:hypothetical protein
MSSEHDLDNWPGFLGEEDFFTPPLNAVAKPAPAAPDSDEIDFGESIYMGPEPVAMRAMPAPFVKLRGAGMVKSIQPATRRLDIAAALSTTPRPRDFALPCLRSGTVGGLVSPGGAGKSMLAVQLALMIACGTETIPGILARPGWKGLKSGRVHYASFEDGEEDAASRLHTIWQAMGSAANAETMAVAAANLHVDTLTGLRAPDLLDGEEWADWMLDACHGKRLVIIDTLRMAHMEDENNSGAMAHLMAVMQGAAMQTGAAVLFLHHVSKGAVLSGQGASQQAARGSSVLTDNARGQFFLANMSEEEAQGSGAGRLMDHAAPGPLNRITLDQCDHDGRTMRSRYVRFGVAKTNYAAPWPDLWLRRDDHGVLACADIRSSASGTPNSQTPRTPAKGKVGARLI